MEQTLTEQEKRELEQGIQETLKKMKEDTYFLSHYDDIGNCYEFSFISDDIWKKDFLFTLFGERLVRLIAMDLNIPPEKIAFGKWGARLIIDDLSNKKIAEYIYKIENHSSFKAFCKTCDIIKDGKTNDFGDSLTNYKEEIRTAFETHYSNSDIIKFNLFKKCAEDWIKEAKEDMEEKDFKKFIENVNIDLSWAKIDNKGRIKQKNPFKRFE